MRIPFKHLLPAIVLLFFAVMSAACGALKQEIRTEDASEKEITGVYSLILYGGTYGNQLEAVAILSKEDSPYTIVPYAPEFDFSIIRHLPAKEALAGAFSFISRHPDFSRAQIARIVDSGGGVIGYEIRPLYWPFTYGAPDVLYTYYWRKGDKVYVDMWLLRKEER
ncbi:MAG TPA: hypothetical protein VJW95_02390 [Dissulfurispiraceae bacterium]|nr:hypothetical protein [Dissulfurispiraceae bacterium]